MAATIDILLATFNGEKYLRQQLDSILCQTDSSWRLIVRDDCSTDGTVAIIEEYRQAFPGKIILLDNGGLNLGSCQNFALLLQYASADYVMFCDQDDVWLPHKISATRTCMHSLEDEFGKESPLMVYTDLKVVGEDIDTVLADSTWEYQQLDPRNGKRLNRLLLHNIPTGCTMLVNRALRELALPIPPEAVMHDWWIALVATAFGQSRYLTDPVILYRQHGTNAVGIEPLDLIREIRKYLTSSSLAMMTARRNEVLNRYRKQAGAFLQRYGAKLSPKTCAMVRAFAELGTHSALMQKYYILRHRFFYSDRLVTAAMILFRW